MQQEGTLRILGIHPLPRDLRSFLLGAGAANRARGTIDYYRQKLTPFLDWLQSQRVQQSPGMTHRTSGPSRAKSQSPGEVHAHYRAVRAFLRWLTREGMLSADATRDVRPSTGEPGAGGHRDGQAHARWATRRAGAGGQRVAQWLPRLAAPQTGVPHRAPPHPKDGSAHSEVAYGLTDLGQEDAGPEQPLGYVREYRSNALDLALRIPGPT